MVTCLFTSAERQTRGWIAPISALLLAVVLTGTASPLRAGTVITLTAGSEIDGKLTVAGAAVHADAESSPPDTALSDVLEANFSDAPFTLHFYDAGKISQVPPNWVAQDIGNVMSHGALAVSNGTFTLTASQLDLHDHDHGGGDRFFFAGVPWPDAGQFTARIVSLTPQSQAAFCGVNLRDSLDPKAPSVSAAISGFGDVRLKGRGNRGREMGENRTTGNLPLWFRLQHFGDTIYTMMSTDGQKWDIINDSPLPDITSPYFGLTAVSSGEKGPGIAAFDNISITPPPSCADVLPAGVVLQGGSVLVCRVANLNLDPSTPDDSGEIIRGKDRLKISRSMIAAVAMLPVDRSQLNDLATKTGLLMRNGDTMDGDISQITSEQVSTSSVLLGNTDYKRIEVRAAIVAPLQAKPAAYEVRLRDGSILNATDVTGTGNTVLITDVSGYSVQVDQGEVAQIRAGTATVQNLAQLAWTANPPTPAAPAAAGANPAPAAPLAQSWAGPNQEQVLGTDVGTLLDFPLPGKFRAFGTQVVLSSDSPPNATVTIRILTDGHELAKSPPFHAGDPPRFLELSLPTASHLTLQAESMFPGVKVLYLDPVAIR